MRACPPEAVGKLELKFLRAAGDAGAVDAVMPAKPSKSEDKLFAEMKTRAPDVAKSTNYQYALAYGEILYGDAHAPMGWLAKVPKGDDNYVRAEYLLGRANLAIAAGQDGADRKASLNAAAQALSVAYTANPDDAATNYFLAESLDDNTGLPSDNAVNAAVNAVDAAPSVYAYAELAALLELRRNDRDDAVTLLTPFSADPHAPKRAQRVKDALTAIRNGATADAVKTALALPQAAPGES